MTNNRNHSYFYNIVQDPVDVALSNDSSSGYTTFSLRSAASTNATLVKTGVSKIGGIHAHNISSTVYVKIYDLDRVPNPATDVPVLRLPVLSTAPVQFSGGNIGIRFQNGIALLITVGGDDTNTQAVVANNVTVNILYA